MTCHTPGPWRWVTEMAHEDVDDGSLPSLLGSNDETVCHFGNGARFYPSEGSPPGDADRALIVAAPELLAACEAALECPNDRAWDMLRAAVAKAHGDTHSEHWGVDAPEGAEVKP